MRCEELAQLAFRQRAGEAVDQLSPLHQEDGGHGADLERRGDLLLLVHVDLGQHERTLVLARQLFQDRPQGLARPAPGGPEIHQHRHVQRLAQDLGFEGVGGGVEYVGQLAHRFALGGVGASRPDGGAARRIQGDVKKT